MDTLPSEETITITKSVNNADNVANNNNETLTEKSLKIKTKDAKISARQIVDETASVLFWGKPKKPAEGKKMKKKLAEVTEENEILKKSLEEKNEEVDELKRTVASLNDVLNSVPIDEIRSASLRSGQADKAVDFGKKQRQLQAELLGVKSKLSKKEIELYKLEREMTKVKDQLKQQADEDKHKARLAELETKLRTTQQKLFESRNRNTELQNQLKLSQKCLEQELGDSSVNLNNLMNSGTGTWRGRAQQIIHLQQKLQEMKERIEKYEAEGAVGITALTLAAQAGCSVVPTTPGSESKLGRGGDGESTASHPSVSCTNAFTFDRVTPRARRSELQHRAKVELLEKEIEDLKAELEMQRSKVLALKVRNKTLNEEILKHKIRANAMEEQWEGLNTTNLAKTNEELNAQKTQLQSRLEEANVTVTQLKREREEAIFREEELQSKLENVETLLAQREAEMGDLQVYIEKLETDIKSLSSDFLFSCRELRKEEFIAILDSLEAEKNYLMDQNKLNIERLQNERNKTASLLEQVNKQKIRIARLEGKIRDMEREHETENKKKERSQRIAEYANSVNGSSSNGSLTSFVVENSNYISGSTPKREDPAKTAELRNMLELSKEKIKILEEKVIYLQKEKENDTKAFEETIANSKQLILKTILTCRSKTQQPSVSNLTTPRSSFSVNIENVPSSTSTLAASTTSKVLSLKTTAGASATSLDNSSKM